MIRRRVPLKRNTKPIARRSRSRQRRKGHRANLARICAELWGAKVRAMNDGRCWADKLYGCGGPIDAAHGLPKGAFPAVRYELWNTLGPLCRAHHDFYGRNWRVWSHMLWREWGPALYAERYGLACATRKLDLAEVRAALEGVA